jgi:single-stranded-DNA-specific exonuclease
MLAALESCAPMMLRFGGHRQAAGLQIESARIKEFRQAVNEWGEARLSPDDLRPRLWLDGPLTFGHINSQITEELNALAPFGPGNPKPVFHTSAVQIVDGPRLLKERHLKASFRQDQRTFRAIAWNAADREVLLAGKKDAVELAFSLEKNEFQGETFMELRVEDFR